MGGSYLPPVLLCCLVAAAGCQANSDCRLRGSMSTLLMASHSVDIDWDVPTEHTKCVLSLRNATEQDPVSVCSYCSKSHAGIRWTVHQSTINKYPLGAYSIDIHFYCSDGETMTSEDICFNGDLFPGLMFISNPTAWRWHMLEHRFSTGAECQFTAEVRNGFNLKIMQRTTSCVIGDKEDQIVPATCTGLNQQGCSCHCSEGFTTDYEIGFILSCINVDECSQGTHHCSDVSNCVDTEGSYYCQDEPNPTPTGRAVISTSESDSVWNPMHTPTPKYKPINAVNSDAVIPSPGPTTSIIPNSLKGDVPDPQADPMCTTTMSVVTTCSTATSTVARCFSQSV